MFNILSRWEMERRRRKRGEKRRIRKKCAIYKELTLSKNMRIKKKNQNNKQQLLRTQNQMP